MKTRPPSNTSNSQSSCGVPVVFREPNFLFTEGHNSIHFDIKCTAHARILRELNGLEEVTLQTYCYSRLELPLRTSLQSSKRRATKGARVWRLNVVIYGTIDLAEIVGGYLSKNRVYLQDPIDCDKNVPYQNPHIVSTGAEIVMTDSFKTPPATVEIERLTVGPDLLARLMEKQRHLPPTEPPSAVITSLFQ